MPQDPAPISGPDGGAGTAPGGRGAAPARKPSGYDPGAASPFQGGSDLLRGGDEHLAPPLLQEVQGGLDLRLHGTDPELAGIQAAKKTSELIPLCHPLLLSKIDVKATPEENGIRVQGTVICTGQTGVEMEALSAISTALLTIYDMCKAVDKTMVISEITLLEKTKADA